MCAYEDTNHHLWSYLSFMYGARKLCRPRNSGGHHSKNQDYLSHVVYDQGRMVTKAQSITAINVGTSKAQTNKLLRYGNDGLGLGNNGMQDDVEELGLQLSDDRKKRWVGLQESGSEDMCLEGYEFQPDSLHRDGVVGLRDAKLCVRVCSSGNVMDFYVQCISNECQNSR
ncbi:hypothetical protein D5086_004001 [Populus alba]|uniref:Uncharacterized protein n=1 Tax=Populus alba TaxID=43335 RepID=A0ACC4CPI2_POPAL